MSSQLPSHMSPSSYCNITYLLIASLLPLCDQHLVRVPVLEQIFVKFLGDSFFLVVKLVDISAPLMRDLEDGPVNLMAGHIDSRCVFGIFHFVAED